MSGESTEASGRALRLACGASALFGLAAVSWALIGRWSHGDEPTLALVLLLATFVTVYGVAGSSTLVRRKRPSGWPLAALNGLALALAVLGLGRLF